MRGGQFAPLRTGSFESARIAWDEAWDLDEVEPLFPVPACVLFGRRRATGKRTPETMTRFAGHMPVRDASEEAADARLQVTTSAAPPPAQIDGGARASAFQGMFRQGATLVPRMLCLVERRPRGRLGSSPVLALLGLSRRTTLEKRPWKDLPPIEKHAVDGQIPSAGLSRREHPALPSVAELRGRRPGQLQREGPRRQTRHGPLGFSGLAGWLRSG